MAEIKYEREYDKKRLCVSTPSQFSSLVRVRSLTHRYPKSRHQLLTAVAPVDAPAVRRQGGHPPWEPGRGVTISLSRVAHGQAAPFLIKRRRNQSRRRSLPVSLAWHNDWLRIFERFRPNFQSEIPVDLFTNKVLNIVSA